MPITASPFRYPGGKSQLYDFVLNLIELNNTREMYIEPFAGGSGLPMKLLLNHEVNNVWINDFDKAIYSVWYSILHHHNELIDLINSVPFDFPTGYQVDEQTSIDFWKMQKRIYEDNREYENSVKLAFATLFLNRTNRSGIINGGPIGGYAQNNTTKIYARFNKNTLINKINAIHAVRQHINLTRLDAIEMIKFFPTQIDVDSSLIFFDPPYYKQGKNLYFSSFDYPGHRQLAERILSLTEFKWITTYDESPQISEMYKGSDKRFEYLLNYSASNKKRGKAPEFMFASPSIKIESFSNVHLTNI